MRKVATVPDTFPSDYKSDLANKSSVKIKTKQTRSKKNNAVNKQHLSHRETMEFNESFYCC